MTQIYFHCSSGGRLLPDRQAVAVESLTEARDHATRIIRSRIRAAGPEDWRSWILHVIDDLGEELFVVPFAFVLGRAH